MKRPDKKGQKKSTYKYHVEMLVQSQPWIGRSLCKDKNECMALASKFCDGSWLPGDLSESDIFYDAEWTEFEVKDTSGRVVFSTRFDAESIKKFGIKVCQDERFWPDLADSEKLYLFAWDTENRQDYTDTVEMELPFDPQRLTIHMQEIPDEGGNYVSMISYIEYADASGSRKFPGCLEALVGDGDDGTCCYMVRNGRWKQIREEMVTRWEEKAQSNKSRSDTNAEAGFDMSAVLYDQALSAQSLFGNESLQWTAMAAVRYGSVYVFYSRKSSGKTTYAVYDANKVGRGVRTAHGVQVDDAELESYDTLKAAAKSAYLRVFKDLRKYVCERK